MQSIKIDDKDKLLIALLQKDARAPVAELARHVHLARSSVQARLKRLEQNGVIQGYHLSLNLERLEQPSIDAHIAITAKAMAQQKLIHTLASFSQVTCCESVSGPSDLSLRVATRSTAELDELLERINQLPGVEHTESNIILKRFFKRQPIM